MFDKKSYLRIDGKFLKEDERIYNLFSDPAGFIISNPDKFHQAPVFNNFLPLEIISAQLQNIFHSLLQSFINGDLRYSIGPENESFVQTESLPIKKAYDIIVIAEGYNSGGYIKLKMHLAGALAKQRITDNELAQILALYYEALPFAEIYGNTHSVSIPVKNISVFSEDDYSNHPDLKKAMNELSEAVKKMSHYLHSFFIHGSMATLDYVYKASDCDTLMILNARTASSPKLLVRVKKEVERLREIFLEIDPLQHHGVFIYTQQDMKYFPQSWLPLVLMDYSKIIFSEADILNYKLRPSIIERRTEFWNITQGMRHQWIADVYPRDINSYKMHLQVVLLMPVFYYQLHGAFVYKKYIFNLLKREVLSGIYNIIDDATNLRNNNLYLKAFLETENSDVGGFEEVPGWLKRESEPDMLMRSAELIDFLFNKEKDNFLTADNIWEDELLHLPQCAGGSGDLWAKYISEACIDENVMKTQNNNIVNVKNTDCALYDYPIKHNMNFYDSTKDKYIKALAKSGAVESVYQMGSVSVPGISDIDFIVVIKDGFNKSCLEDCISSFYALAPEELYVIKHPPSAFLSAELLKKVSWLHPTFKLVHLFGVDILKDELEQAPPVNQLINLADLFLMEFPIEFIEEIKTKNISVRNHLMRMKSLSLSAKILEMNKIPLPPVVSEFISKTLTLFNNWFSSSEEDNRNNFAGILNESENVIYEMILLIKKGMNENGLNVECEGRIAGIYAGNIFFIKDWSIETAMYLSGIMLAEHGLACSILPAEFLYSIIRYSKDTGALGSRIRKYFWINSTSCAIPCKELELRTEALSLHYELLKKQELNGGIFYPYHFCPEYWNPDLITALWHSEIDKAFKEGKEFSENFLLNSINKWKTETLNPIEIEKDKDEVVTLSFADGFYKRENNIRWIKQSGRLFITSKYPLEISFELVNLQASYYSTFPLEVEILIDGLIFTRSIFIESNQINEVFLSLNDLMETHEILIKASSCFTPKGAGLNEDIRELSVYIKDPSITILDKPDISAPSYESGQETQDEGKMNFNGSIIAEPLHDKQKEENLDIGKAEELIEGKKYYEAKQILSKILGDEPENTLALNDLAVVSILEENYEDAQLLLNVILELDPQNETATENLKYLIENKLVNAAINSEVPQQIKPDNKLTRPTTRNFLNYEPGHYYSPIPDMDYIVDNSARIFDFSRRSTKGVDLNAQKQLELLEVFSQYDKEIPFPFEKGDKYRFYFNNDFYSYGDAVINFSMMRHFKPKRIIEVGSGFSSACMLDTSDYYLNGRVQFTFIEPYADRLKSLLRIEDKHRYRIIEAPVQSVEPHEFEVLGENDILFIDSSHVVKTGSDVEYLFTEVLPVLNKGVIIHFHDIHYPFEYPKDWVYEGRAWNEMYFVKTFLQYNNTFSILYFNTFMQTVYLDLVSEKTPNFRKNCGGGLWIRKDK